MSRSRREDILDAEVLLVVRRPDEKAITVLRLIFGAIFAVLLGDFILTASAPWGFMLIFCTTMLGLYVVVFFFGINTYPVILTEKGISQKLVQSLYWCELEGYTWLPWLGRYFQLNLQPSCEASVFVQFNQFRGSYRGVHVSCKEDMNKIFHQNGLREIV